jgi:hypothetical protein
MTVLKLFLDRRRRLGEPASGAGQNYWRFAATMTAKAKSNGGKRRARISISRPRSLIGSQCFVERT